MTFVTAPGHSRAFAIFRGVLFAVVGLGLFVGGVFEVRGGVAFEHRALRAAGTVIGLNAGSSHPEIRFTTWQGQTLEYPQGGLISGYQPGQRVIVLYDPQHPQDATLDTFGARWGFTVMGFLGGVVFMVVGLMTLPRRSQP